MRRAFFGLPLFTSLAASAMLLAGCGTTTGGSPANPPAAVVPPAPSPRDVLDTERQRLAELFRGTPVVFVTTSNGNLRATVPRRFCFDAGSTQVKPPLAAVLDRIAKSQLKTASHIRLAVPSDPNAASQALAHDRALRVRDYMTGQGIAATRMQVTGVTTAEQLELIVIAEQPA